MPQEITVRLEGVAKSFGETKALRRCDIEARAGEVHAIVGENGSGKSTTAKIMSGILRPDEGTVVVLGERIDSPLDAKRLGLATIFQEVLVADEGSVLDNLCVGRDGLFRSQGSRSDRRREAGELLARLVGHPVELSRPVGDLPLSQKQWIVIARAILRRPRVLILDESSAALDLDATLRLHAELERLKAAGTTILIVTHRIAELVRIADRATILRDGTTVTCLEKHDITETNLLAWMTPAERNLSEAAHGAAGRAAGKQGETIVEARGMVSRHGAEPFDFMLPAGAIVGVAGLDGQGQDAFLRSVARVMTAMEGHVAIRPAGGAGAEFVPVHSLADATRQGIAYVSGDRKREGIFPQQSIFENLAIGIYRRNLGPLGVIRKSGLTGVFEREVERLRVRMGSPQNRITSLSGGNQQKILIGRAFAADPRVIVLNDPARGVDLGTKRDLYRELRAFADGGGSVIYLSSEIEEFLGFADRVDVFHAGRLFRSLGAGEIDEDSILAAMFGRSRQAISEFVSGREVH